MRAPLARFKSQRLAPRRNGCCKKRGIEPDYVPDNSISEAVAVGLLERGAGGKRVLIVRALEGREALETRLMEGGARVVIAPVYRTVPDHSNADDVRERMTRSEVGWVSFTSSSTVLGFLDAIGREFVSEHRAKFRVAVIGPITAKTARENGLNPDVEAGNASVEALADAIRGFGN